MASSTNRTLKSGNVPMPFSESSDSSQADRPDLILVSEDEYSSSRSSTIHPVFAPPAPDPWSGGSKPSKDLYPHHYNRPQDKYDDAKRRFLDDLRNYIPIGSFLTSKSGPEEDIYTNNSWTESMHPVGDEMLKGGEVRGALWFLVYGGWVRLFVKVHKDMPSVLNVRVYVLPDDVGRRYMDRNIESQSSKRLQLKKLILFLDLSAQAWAGDRTGQLTHAIRSLDKSKEKGPGDEDSLFYLFNTITLPAPTAAGVECQYSRQAMSSLLDSDSKLGGLRTDLYPYQRRSAATMIRREVKPARVLDPRLEPFEGPVGKNFYYDQETGILLRDRRTYEEARGGILAETMGLGKTLICLATVLATKGHWPHVPPEYSLDRHPVRTHVGTLAEMAAAAIGRNQIPWRAFFHGLSRAGEDHGKSVSLLERNIGSYVIPPSSSGRTRQPSTKGQAIRLCTATLIVVPLNLFTQWQGEMAVHLEPEALKILSVQALDTPMPSEDDILTCDVVLISKQRFEREMKPLDINPIASKKAFKCICATDGYCNCAAAGPNYHSSLRSIHFLRIIVDEGHDFASSGGTNNAIWALRRLHVDRRWIVSGTPSAGLLGVEVGLSSKETSRGTEEDNIIANLEAQNEEGLRTRAFRGYVYGTPRERELDLQRQASANLQEYKDLQKLGRIVVDFLGTRPWANARDEDPASWQKYVLPSKDGIRKPRSLRTILESLVVRHRIEDVRLDIKLPVLHNKVVYLEASWHDKLSINLFLLVLTANAVTSQRCDRDYMFHPKNRPQLNVLIANLRQSGFYWTSFTPDSIAKTIEVSQKYMAEQKDTNPVPKTTISTDNIGPKDGDMDLLQRAIDIGQTALASPSWSSIAFLHELGLYVENFPVEAREAWSLVGAGFTEPLLMGASQLAKAQQSINTRLYAPLPGARLVEEGKAAMRGAWLKVAGNGKMGNSLQGEVQKRTKDPNLKTLPSRYQGEPKLLNKHTVSKVRTGGSRPRKQRTIPVLEPSGIDSDTPRNHLGSALRIPSASSLEPAPLLGSPLEKTRLCGTASAKLSYLLDRIVEIGAEEKSLVFYEGDNIAYYIAQAFEVINIRFLIYTGSLATSRKNAYIHTFNTTDTFRVMLMDIRQAAHGLHVASASRVFFLNPVWQPNIEAQAIKRAHRIGQARPVFVETLVLKDTLEDRMLSRRNGMTVTEHLHAQKSLLDDPIMSELIQESKFIPFTEKEVHDPRLQMAPLKYPQQLFGRVSSGVGHPDDANAGLIFPNGKNIEVKQWRKRKSSESFAFAPDMTLSPLSRQRRELNQHNNRDYLSPTKDRAADSPSHKLDRAPFNSPQASLEFAGPDVLVPGTSLVEVSPKEKVGFAVDEAGNFRATSSTEAPADLSDTNGYSRSAPKSDSLSSKRVAFSIDERTDSSQDQEIFDTSLGDSVVSPPTQSSSLFGDGSRAAPLPGQPEP